MGAESKEGSPSVLMVISAPSGAGKTTLAKALLGRYEDMRICVSHTTRPPRTGDVHGQDYYFLSPEAFDQMVLQNAFLEWAHVHDQRYGTSHAELARLREQGFSVLFDVDYQGGISIMKDYPDAVSVFILPPSLDELDRRIRKRASDSAEIIERRLESAKIEMTQYPHYQYAIVNDDLESAIDAIESIYRAEKQKTERMKSRIEPIVPKG